MNIFGVLVSRLQVGDGGRRKPVPVINHLLHRLHVEIRTLAMVTAVVESRTPRDGFANGVPSFVGT